MPSGSIIFGTNGTVVVYARHLHNILPALVETAGFARRLRCHLTRSAHVNDRRQLALRSWPEGGQVLQFGWLVQGRVPTVNLARLGASWLAATVLAAAGTPA